MVYTRNEEVANSLTHAFGIVAGCIWGVFMLYRVVLNSDRWLILGLALYVAGMLCSYMASTFYHSCRQHTRPRSWLRKCDHAAIYLHIAGSYAPFALGPMWENSQWGIAIFAWTQLCALVGVAVSFIGLKEHSYIETLCFILMGCSIAVCSHILWQSVPHASVYWILGEGAMFITGALFYSLRKARYMHTVFHVFVLLGSVCHLMALEQIVKG